MIMSAGFRKCALTVHVTCSVGMLGAVAAFLVLSLKGLTDHNPELVRATYAAMDLIAWFVLVPLAFAALATGLLQALGTNWGLFRHYWVLAKLLLTVIVTAVLLLQLEPISYVAAVAAERTLAAADLREARISFVVHAGGGLIVLLLPIVLSLYKPRGMTRYGWRKRHAPRVRYQGDPIGCPHNGGDG